MGGMITSKICDTYSITMHSAIKILVVPTVHLSDWKSMFCIGMNPDAKIYFVPAGTWGLFGLNPRKWSNGMHPIVLRER